MVLPAATTQPSATAATSPIPAPQKSPSSLFRIVFLLLLIATLVSAAATTYILIGNKKTIESAQLTSVDANPFASAPPEEFTNPFADGTNLNEPVATFTDSSADNFFDLFETDTGEVSTEAGTQEEYVNPF